MIFYISILDAPMGDYFRIQPGVITRGPFCLVYVINAQMGSE